MTAVAKRKKPEQTLQSRHLSLRAEDSRPRELRFGFEEAQGRVRKAVGGSLLGHAGIIGAYLLILWIAPEPVRNALLPDALSRQLVFLAEPGPGGGGGGGNTLPEPPKKAELKKPDKKEEVSVPVKVEPKPEPKVEEPPKENLNIPAITLADAEKTAPGVIDSDTLASLSTGSGRGTGAGAGEGSGLGLGTGGGTGGGVYRPGSGVINPRVLREVKPQYTADAMRAKVQGTVLLECVVMPDGSVGRVDVVKSLDPTFGLDAEAVKAAKQWRFQPGTRFGEPVAVLVTIELTFTLR
jgi:protein TonB